MRIRGRVRPFTITVFGLALIIPLAAACGSGSTDATPTATSEAANTVAPQAATQPPTVPATATSQQPNAEARVSANDGKATLLIPEGALPEGVSASDISVVAIPAFTEDTGEIRVIADYELLPDGLQLLKPVILEVPIPDDLEASLLFVIHISGETVEFPLPEVVFDEATGSATMLVELTHFSNLAVLAHEAVVEQNPGGSIVVEIEGEPERRVGESFNVAIQRPTFGEVTFEATDGGRVYTLSAVSVDLGFTGLSLDWDVRPSTTWLEFLSNRNPEEWATRDLRPGSVGFEPTFNVRNNASDLTFPLSDLTFPLVVQLRCLRANEDPIRVDFSAYTYWRVVTTGIFSSLVGFTGNLPFSAKGSTMMKCIADPPTETPPTETPVPDPPTAEPPPPEPPGTVSGTVNIGGTEITAEITTNVPSGTNVEATVCHYRDGEPVSLSTIFLTYAPKAESPSSPSAAHQNAVSDASGCASFSTPLGSGQWNAYTGLEGTNEVARFGFELNVCEKACGSP